MPLSFMPLSVSAPFRFCPFPFMPLSGLMEIVDYAGFLYANFRAPAVATGNLMSALPAVMAVSSLASTALSFSLCRKMIALFTFLHPQQWKLNSFSSPYNIVSACCHGNSDDDDDENTEKSFPAECSK
jgi:hypothetical protein